jgi:NADPH-dependent glutamate synthase beta subunit-like oxidoreductase
MPAYAEEIQAAIDEGVSIVPLMAPVSISTRGGKLAGVRFVRNRLGEKDAGGRQRPMPIPGSETEIPLDTLIIAIGEQPETDSIPELTREKWGGIRADADTMCTSVPGVFGGGDVVTGPNTVIEAVAAGKKAARLINRHLAGKGLSVFQDVKLPEVYIRPVEAEESDGKEIARVAVPHLPVEKRKKSQREVELCISAHEAGVEARRCLRCDLEFTQGLERGHERVS